jgi:hypothetical protein
VRAASAGSSSDRRSKSVDDDVALLNGSSALTHLISVDLPEPEGPQTTTTSPLLMLVSNW